MVAGENGSGKTMYAFHHPLKEFGFYFDLENRYSKILEIHPLIKKNQYRSCLCIDENFDDDPIKTIKKVRATLKKVFQKKEIKLIVIDGISDLRRMVADEWSVKNAEKGRPKVPYGPKAWGEINHSVKKILHRLFNYARAFDKTVIISAWMADDYVNNEKTGTKSMDVKDFIIARVDETLNVKRKGTHFLIRRGKSPLGPTKWIPFELPINKQVEQDDE